MLQGLLPHAAAFHLASGRGQQSLALLQLSSSSMSHVTTQAFGHSAASVRAAAATAIGALTEAAYMSLAVGHRRLVWVWLDGAGCRDSAAAVRAAGLKSVGSLALLTGALKDPGDGVNTEEHACW